MTSPRANELQSMSNWELYDKLLFDPSNASRYRNKLFERMAEKGMNSSKGLLNGDTSVQSITSAPLITSAPVQRTMTHPTVSRARNVILETIESRKAYCYAAETMINSGWDFIDPEHKMMKAPDEVVDFLQATASEVGMYGDLFASRRNLFKMIMDAWLRWTIVQGNELQGKE